MAEEQRNDDSFYDVVVVGGALSGAATAILLLRKNPGLRLLIVEKSAQLTRRVGEATVEVSASFLGRVLGLTQYLNEHHLLTSKREKAKAKSPVDRRRPNHWTKPKRFFWLHSF